VKLSRLLESIYPHQIRSIFSGNTSIPVPEAGGIFLPHDPDIRSIHFNSRDVQPGGLFVAIPGTRSDGHDYIDNAIQRGALAIVSQKPFTPSSDICAVQVYNARKSLAFLASRFYGEPSEHMTVIAVTGTNGKTTTAYLIEKILQHAGFSVGVTGTLNSRFCGKVVEASMTTPESLDLQRMLSEMKECGVTHVVMEASSHAIALNRIDACWMDVAVFTNLTQDHLDFHGNMEDYWRCKKSLFTKHLTAGPKKDRAIAVVNGNDGRGKELMDELPSALSFGFDNHCQLWPNITRKDQSGMSGIITTPQGTFTFDTPLIGNHNVENILAAAAVGAALKLPLDDIRAGIEAVRFVPGRLQRVSNTAGRFVFVDYAHTPDALEHALKALRSLSTARIICVFGCGGDRDRGKRPLMGRIAADLSSVCIVTSDNPRSEDPIAIIQDILAGVEAQGMRSCSSADLNLSSCPDAQGFIVEPDRTSAIELAVRISRQEDIILIAGKGHENYQIIGERKIASDDRLIAEKALKTIKTTS
jgi:UDP-N-acetylmuramyl-tripeptide synthetase